MYTVFIIMFICIFVFIFIFILYIKYIFTPDLRISEDQQDPQVIYLAAKSSQNFQNEFAI